MKRSYIREILDATDENTISFAGGLPQERLFPLSQIQKATTKVLQNRAALQYSSSVGLETLRTQIAHMYSTLFDFPTSKEEIMITTGSQQAFDVILKIFGKKEVLVQNPTYIGALGSFKTQGFNVRGFENLDELEAKLHADNDVYMMSDFINPTGESLSQKKREAIAKILHKKGNILLEDGAYSLLSFDGTVQKPIASMYENSFHVGSFSKIIAPGLRVGWIRASKEKIDKILIAKEALDLHTPTLNQMIIAQFLQDNDVSKHLKKIQSKYEERMEFMSACLKKYVPQFYFIKPKGGMFIYGSFNQESFALAKKLLEKNVAIVPAQVFYADDRQSNEARLNFTNASNKQIIKGLKILQSLISDEVKAESIWMNLFSSVFYHPKV
jgi:DNA-binding transcriptional MocR family regulator